MPRLQWRGNPYLTGEKCENTNRERAGRFSRFSCKKYSEYWEPGSARHSGATVGARFSTGRAAGAGRTVFVKWSYTRQPRSTVITAAYSSGK